MAQPQQPDTAEQTCSAASGGRLSIAAGRSSRYQCGAMRLHGADHCPGSRPPGVSFTPPASRRVAAAHSRAPSPTTLRTRISVAARSNGRKPVTHPASARARARGRQDRRARPADRHSRRAAAAFGWAGALAVHAGRRRAAAPEDLHIVDPAVAEVVAVLELGAEIGEQRAGFVALVLGPHVVAGHHHSVGRLRCDELVQMRAGPPDRGLQQLMQLRQGRRRGDVDPGDRRLDVAQSHPQARGIHSCASVPADVVAAQHFFVLSPRTAPASAGCGPAATR